MLREAFDWNFKNLLGFSPFKWQEQLFRNYFSQGNIPPALDIPTGLGKTSVMAIWYLALKAGAPVPRRLVYVVDRRAVVDQATTEADKIKERSNDCTLRVSTLRGQHVDNREWLTDPTAPAIIVGTVDMIGSRLLFSGYGVSRKMRPYHAGLLGADALVVLDEAHLVPPFEYLLKAIENGTEMFGPREQRDQAIIPPLKLLSLSATGREDGTGRQKVFRLSPEQRKDDIVETRLNAPKSLTIQVLDDARDLAPKLAEKAWSLGRKPSRVLVYCDRREHAVKVKDMIKKEKSKPVCELLVGGRRIFERDALSGWLNQHGFVGDAEGPPKQPTFLIATSAGEVGVDLDADHMVCDLVEWERMVQRLGRVNRRGKGDAKIKVITAPRKNRPKPETKIKEWKKDWNERLERLRKPLDALRRADEDLREKALQTSGCEGSHDASPGAILDLKLHAEQDQDLKNAIEEATTSAPLRPALTRALVDAWSLTSLDEHAGRPEDIQPWLRGWEEDPQPQTRVIWRKHLPARENGAETTKKEIESFFEAAPPHASEELETETSRVIDWLQKRTKKVVLSQSENSIGPNEVVAYVLSPSGDLRHTLLWSKLEEMFSRAGKKGTNAKNILNEILYSATLVVDARFGGLSRIGLLDDKEQARPRVIDDGEEWLPSQPDGSPAIRFRVRSVTAATISESDENWRERHRFEVDKTEEGDVTEWLLVEKWRSNSETDDDRSIGASQELTEHEAWAEGKARTLANTLGLSDAYTDMLALAARLHDEGKHHKRWQRAFNAPRDGKVYAKTSGPINVRLLEGYRHEFGSLPCAENDEKFKALPHDLQELVLHLIAAHHGWARPVISIRGADSPPSALEERAQHVALRFAHLQKRFGPWGLAWLEAILRAADHQASRENDSEENG